MISFRFHLVSIASVFLALALGIFIGANLVNQATVNVLENRIKSVRRDVAAARDDLHVWTTFGDQAENALIAGRLEGVRVLTIVPEGVSGDVTGRLHSTLATAGAIDAGTLTIDEKWADEAPRSRSDIAEVLGIVGPISVDAITAEAAARLARDFANGGGETLPMLTAANLVQLEAGDAALTPGVGARIVIVDNGAPSGLLEPLSRALGSATAMPSRVLVADAGPEDEINDSLVGLLRHDPGDTKLSTLDHLQTTQGRVAAVLALRDFERGVTGDYGSGPGADRAVPASG
ncbi:MAG: hypothetical protein QOF21_2777 [Actinomycetota bacterium]|jgi:hypothetical protein